MNQQGTYQPIIYKERLLDVTVYRVPKPVITMYRANQSSIHQLPWDANSMHSSIKYQMVKLGIYQTLELCIFCYLCAVVRISNVLTLLRLEVPPIAHSPLLAESKPLWLFPLQCHASQPSFQHISQFSRAHPPRNQNLHLPSHRGH